MTKKSDYSFGEKAQEFIDGKNIPVWQSPKYIASKAAAIKLIESKDFGGIISENDFWILMNKTKSGKMAYTGLIISHEALLKINAVLPNDLRFREEYCSNPIMMDYAGKKGMYMIYRDKRDGMMEVGEITPENCKNSYPFAMLFKRTFDRVVKRKANLLGFYSDSEADEFRGTVVDSDTGEILKSDGGEDAAALESEKEEKPIDSVDFTNLDDALMHPFDGGNVWKGKMVKDLVKASDQSDAQKSKYLNMYQTRGTAADRAACSVVAAAIKDGRLKFENSINAA